MPFSRIFKNAAPIIVLLIPLFLLIPGWEGFVYSPRSDYSDLAISHYPNAIFLLKSLQQGQLPLWSSSILGGYPFAADPLAGIWYLPGWIAYLFPLPLGFNINVLLHFYFNGIGMWLFLRGSGLSDFPSLVGAIAWELLPKIFAHFGAGHLTLIYAITWTPWLLLAQIKSSHNKPDAWSAIIFGMIALADVRWLAYAGVLWFLFHTHQWMGELGSIRGIKERLNQGFVWLRSGLVTILAAGMMAAPLLAPLLEFTNASTRASMKVEDNLALALSPIQLFGVLAPNFQGYAEWMAYSGGAVLIAVFWAICFRGLRKKVIFWIGIMAAALLLSMGASFPPNYWIARLPGWDLLRVPSRFMLLFGFSGAVILANFLDMTLREWMSASLFWGNLITFGTAAFTWVIVAGLWLITGEPTWPYLWSAAVISLVVVLFMLYKGRILSREVFQTIILLSIVLDLGTTSYSEYTYRQNSAVFAQGDEPASTVKESERYFRIYSPTYSISQQTAMKYDLESIHGIDPMQLRAFVQFLEPALGIVMEDYSVTIPPFQDGDPKSSNQKSQLDTGLLGMMNVKYVLSEYPILSPGLTEWKMTGSTYIYQNQAWRTRAWVQPDTEDRNKWKPAEVTNYSPNQISISADGPGTLVLSETSYPGWQILVDGIPNDGMTIFGLFRGINLDAGRHEVVFLFRPISTAIGLALAFLAWIWVFSQLVIRRKPG